MPTPRYRMTPTVNICCISSIAEARTAIDLDASALGLVGRMPSGPGPIPDALIREIAHSVPPPVGTFLLTSETSVDGIRRRDQLADTNAIQIVDALSGGTYAQLNVALPSTEIIQVIHVLGRKSIGEAVEISEQVDALLLDSGNPNLRIKELGGTGGSFRWASPPLMAYSSLAGAGTPLQ